MDLNANHCGKALLKVAGAELLNECQKIGSLMAGDMASTGPAKLNCKRVYHVRSSSWSSGIGAPVLLFKPRSGINVLIPDLCRLVF